MARKLTYSVASSLDGFIATKDGGVEWLKMSDLEEAGGEMAEFFASIDTIIFGRKTYEKGLEMGGGGSSPGIRNIVFTKSDEFEPADGVEFVKEDASEFVRELKKAEGKDILLMGGGELASSLLSAGLIEVIIVGIQPVVLGEGVPVFGNDVQMSELERCDLKTRKSGTVQVSYRVKKSG